MNARVMFTVYLFITWAYVIRAYSIGLLHHLNWHQPVTASATRLLLGLPYTYNLGMDQKQNGCSMHSLDPRIYEQNMY